MLFLCQTKTLTTPKTTKKRRLMQGAAGIACLKQQLYVNSTPSPLLYTVLIAPNIGLGLRF